MINRNVHDLLTELAEVPETPDVAPRAWDTMLRRRTRRRLAVGSGAAALVVVAGGAVYLRGTADGTDTTRPGPAVTTRDPRPAPQLDGYRVWSAPSLDREATLARVPSALPPTIDLSRPNPSVRESPIERAVAAFGVVKVAADSSTHFVSVMFVTADGGLRHLDELRLEELDDPTGNPYLPFNGGSLSPDGTKVALLEAGGVAVYDLGTNSWQRFELAGGIEPRKPFAWSDDGRQLRLGLSTVDLRTGTPGLVKSDETPLDATALDVESWWGPERIEGDNRARGAGYLNLPDPPLAGVESNPPAVVVDGGVKSLLLVPDQGERWKNCCAVGGWLDARTVAYESRFGDVTPGAAGQTIRLLAWDVLDGDVGLASTITGASDMLFVASYSQLPGR